MLQLKQGWFMAQSPHKQNEAERVELLRGSSVVSSLATAFGLSLRETRLTAVLGYLIALTPEAFMEAFGFKGLPISISLETFHDRDRSDIMVETTKGTGIIEAKTSPSNPLRQSMKYKARWRVLLTPYLPSGEDKKHSGIRYMTWRELARLVTPLSRSANPSIRFIAGDLLNYMEEHNMIITKDRVEIYAREINEEDTLAFFLKAHLYGCHYEKGSRLPEALYFAPHFGQGIAKAHPGIHVGISYIAKIETVEVVETWGDFRDVVIAVRGKAWLNNHKFLLDPIHRGWDWRKKTQRSFLFLSPPRMVFNPPIHKEHLQTGSGWLSKRFLSFDELFDAWGC